MPHAPDETWLPTAADRARRRRAWVFWTGSVVCLCLLTGCSTVNTQKSVPGYSPRSTQEEKGFLNLGGLFEKEPSPPKSVREFMSLPRTDM